jgi:hypothetical protein
MSEERDPTVIRSLAVTASDVVAAVEAQFQRGVPVVLRATPPFSGRMRARLHVVDEGAATEPESVHVDPTAMLAASAPPYPRPSDTEDQLRADPSTEYTVERHHERHQRAVEGWRRAVHSHFVDEVTVETPAGDHTVAVVVLD